MIIAGAFADVDEQFRRLPQLHAGLWAIFAPVGNRTIFYEVERRSGVTINGEHLDVMIDHVIEVAKARGDGRTT